MSSRPRRRSFRADGYRDEDLATPGVAEKLVAGRPDVIFHTAGIVSAEAELDFDKGYRSNLDGMRALLEAVRSRRRPFARN